MRDRKGCCLCKYLEYYEKDGYEDFAPEGYYCDFKDTEHFKKFPCERKLKCFKSIPKEEKK